MSTDTPVQRMRAAFTRIAEDFDACPWTFDTLTGKQQDAWNELAEALQDVEAEIEVKSGLVMGDGCITISNMTFAEAFAALDKACAMQAQQVATFANIAWKND